MRRRNDVGALFLGLCAVNEFGDAAHEGSIATDTEALFCGPIADAMMVPAFVLACVPIENHGVADAARSAAVSAVSVGAKLSGIWHMLLNPSRRRPGAGIVVRRVMDRP